jgi:hypothetical protein
VSSVSRLIDDRLEGNKKKGVSCLLSGGGGVEEGGDSYFSSRFSSIQ